MSVCVCVLLVLCACSYRLASRAALNAESLAKLKAIAESEQYAEMDAAAFEDMTVRSQAVLVDSNAVNVGSIAPAVR